MTTDRLIEGDSFNTAPLNTGSTAVLIMFGCGWRGLQLEKVGQCFKALPVHFREGTTNGGFLFALPRRKSLIFTSRCRKSNCMIQNRFFVKKFSSLDQNTANSP